MGPMTVVRPACAPYRRPHRVLAPRVARGWRVVTLVAGLAVGGCATAPPEAPPRVALPEPVVTAPTCPSCDEQRNEVARLRQDLASREAELRDLRAAQREQVRSLQESTREVTRAKVRLRRLATQADAASYLAEVEVALDALRNSLPATPPVPLLAMALALLDGAAAPFAQGDYGAAMDRAAQAEQLVAIVADSRAAQGSRARAPDEVPLQVTIPVRLTVDSNLRRQPLPRAPIVALLKQDSPLVAQAWKGDWMRVQTEDGRAGWVRQTQLGVR